MAVGVRVLDAKRRVALDVCVCLGVRPCSNQSGCIPDVRWIKDLCTKKVNKNTTHRTCPSRNRLLLWDCEEARSAHQMCWEPPHKQVTSRVYRRIWCGRCRLSAPNLLQVYTFCYRAIFCLFNVLKPASRDVYYALLCIVCTVRDRS